MRMRKAVSLLAPMALAVLVACAVWLVAFEGPDVSAQTQEQERPNIIFVMTDDQDENSLEHMPYVSGDFRASATTFPNATFNYPLCCPSRTSILRGQYTHNHNVWENAATNGGGYEKFLAEGLDKSIYPIWLDNAGYQTAGFGSYVNQYNPNIHGTPAGFDFFRYHNRDWDNKPVASDVYKDEQTKQNAVRWLKENVSGGPLMMWASFYAPHEPYNYDPIYADRFTETVLPKEPSFNEPDVTDKPEYIRNLPRLTDEEVAQLEENHRNRLRGLLTPDDAVRQLVEAVDAAGETDNTYFVFWTDNGWLMGQHGLRNKRHAYLESASFPMLVKGPGVPKGASDGRIVMNQDLAPTFADIADAPVPKFVDGRSMVPIFDGSGAWRDVGLIQASPPLTVRQPTEYRGIRDENYTYVEYTTGEKEYYDLVADPYQLENGYGALTDERKAELAARLTALKGCVTNECRTAEGGGALPATPTGLTATPSPSGVALDWADSGEGGLAGYNVYRAESEWGPFTQLNAAPLTTSGYDDAGAPEARPSHYWVTAVNAVGDESDPATVSATRPDATNPTVRRVIPAEGATGVSPATHVRAMFSEAVTAGSVTANTVRLYQAGSSTVLAATVTYDATKKRATLDPSAPLLKGKRYRVVVSQGVRDLAGNRLDQDPNAAGNQSKRWFFTVRK